RDRMPELPQKPPHQGAGTGLGEELELIDLAQAVLVHALLRAGGRDRGPIRPASSVDRDRGNCCAIVMPAQAHATLRWNAGGANGLVPLRACARDVDPSLAQSSELDRG